MKVSQGGTYKMWMVKQLLRYYKLCKMHLFDNFYWQN